MTGQNRDQQSDMVVIDNWATGKRHRWNDFAKDGSVVFVERRGRKRLEKCMHGGLAFEGVKHEKKTINYHNERC